MDANLEQSRRKFLYQAAIISAGVLFPAKLFSAQASKESVQKGIGAGAQRIGVFNFETKKVLLSSGYEMPIVGIGTYSLSHDVCVKSVMEHLKAGGRLIDTAFM